MGGGRTIVRKLPKNYQTIRACAAFILQSLDNPTIPLDLKRYGNATVREAYRLLVFEGLVRRATGFTLTERGAKHVTAKGYEVYPRIAIALARAREPVETSTPPPSDVLPPQLPSKASA